LKHAHENNQKIIYVRGEHFLIKTLTANLSSNAKRNMHKKILQWSIVQKNILAKNMIQYIKRNVVHNIFFTTFIIIADPFNESE